MPQLRKPSVRRMTSKLRKTTSDAEKIRMLRTLYMIVYNDEQSLIPQGVELFHVLGDILEGTSPEELQLHWVNKDTFLAEYALYEAGTPPMLEKKQGKKPAKRRNSKTLPDYLSPEVERQMEDISRQTVKDYLQWFSSAFLKMDNKEKRQQLYGIIQGLELACGLRRLE